MKQNVRGFSNASTNISLNYYESYVEGRNPARKYHMGFTSALKDAMKYVFYSNISVSVWGYGMLSERSFVDPETGRHIRYKGIDYNSAFVDRVFLDFDVLKKDGTPDYDVLDSFNRYLSWVMDNDYRFEVAFTGGGYQTTFSVSCTSDDYVYVVRDLEEKLDLKIDSVSLADLRRVVGSFNFGKESKSERNRWCISLYYKELALDFDEHREIARKRRTGMNYYGTQTYMPKIKPRKEYGLRHLDTDPNFSLDAGVDEILDRYGWSYDDLCPYIRKIIEQPHVRHKERLYLISYFKNIVGIEYADMLILWSKILVGSHGSETDGTHSIREGQIKSVYMRNLPFNVDVMHKEGLCPSDCDRCAIFQKELWRIAYG